MSGTPHRLGTRLSGKIQINTELKKKGQYESKPITRSSRKSKKKDDDDDDEFSTMDPISQTPQPLTPNGAILSDKRLATALGISEAHWTRIGEVADDMIEDDVEFIFDNLSSAASQRTMANYVRQLKGLCSDEVLLTHPDSDNLLTICFNKIVKESRSWLRKNKDEEADMQCNKFKENIKPHVRDGSRNRIQDGGPSSTVVQHTALLPVTTRNLRERRRQKSRMSSSSESGNETVIDQPSPTPSRLSIKISPTPSRLSIKIPSSDTPTSTISGISFDRRIASDASPRLPLTFILHQNMSSSSKVPIVLHDSAQQGKLTLQGFENIWNRLTVMNGGPFDLMELTVSGINGSIFIPRSEPQDRLTLFLDQDIIKQRVGAMKVMVMPMVNEDYDFECRIGCDIPIPSCER